MAIFFNPFNFNIFGGKKNPVQEVPKPSLRETARAKPVLQYPLNIEAFQKRPIINFAAYAKDGKTTSIHNIFFPCPGNIQINDSAEYNSITLDFYAGGLQDASSSLRESSGLGGGILAAGKTAGKILGSATSLKGTEAAAIAREFVPFGDEVKGATKLAARQVINPNTNTTFERNAVRSFEFNFKMIAKTKQETEEINRIHKKFRKFIYADTLNDATNVVLNYPPVWTIKFLTNEGIENPYIPKIYSCYLTSFNTTFNGENNMYFRDNAPFEVDVSMTYQETRNLTREDILSLEDDADTYRGMDANGIPTLTTPRTK